MSQAVEQAIVLAVGRGTSLRPLTRNRPMIMLPVLGKPVAVRVMERLRPAGIGRFAVVIDEQGGELAAYLKSSWYPDLNVSLTVQLMTAGLGEALAQAASTLDGPFVLTSADILTPPDFVPKLVRWFEMSGKDMVIGLGQTPYSQAGSFYPVQVAGDTLAAIEPASQDMPDAAYGAFLTCVCVPSLLPYLTDVDGRLYGERDLVGCIQRMLRDGVRIGYMLADWHVRLMHVDDLLGFNRFLLEEGADAHILSELPGSVRVVVPVRVDPQVSVGPGAQIGPNVYLEAGSTVGQGAQISDSVVLTGGVVAAGARV
ncbi:MAG: NDP-sugar synthase, partial [Anaerolineae bacterium]|nr:NDP-sugar synthase [Anaerolineae bacterium]